MATDAERIASALSLKHQRIEAWAGATCAWATVDLVKAQQVLTEAEKHIAPVVGDEMSVRLLVHVARAWVSVNVDEARRVGRNRMGGHEPDRSDAGGGESRGHRQEG